MLQVLCRSHETSAVLISSFFQASIAAENEKTCRRLASLHETAKELDVRHATLSCGLRVCKQGATGLGMTVGMGREERTIGRGVERERESEEGGADYWKGSWGRGDWLLL